MLRLGVVWLAIAAGGASAADYRAPRTPAGRPSLEGLWTTSTLTPVARPDELKSLVLTDAEAAEYERKHRGKPPPALGETVFSATSEPIYEFACHEGNYGLPNILAGGREAEKLPKPTGVTSAAAPAPP